MRICWDNLEKLRYSKKTCKWYLGQNTYIHIDSCNECGNDYLSNIYKISDFCSISCSHKNKSFSDKTKKLMRKNHANFKRENHPRWKGGYRINHYIVTIKRVLDMILWKVLI